MIRKIIQIDQEKCNGCGICTEACHEGAIGMIEGKAVLLRDDYCDGLGDCLPTCPTGAITFIEREAAAFDKAAVMENQKKKMLAEHSQSPQGCPGSRSRQFSRRPQEHACSKTGDEKFSAQSEPASADTGSQLRQWPVQIKLAPINAPYFDGARLLIAADCSAYAYGNFHKDFIQDSITLIGCPKLDSVDYSEKLTEILRQNEIKSLTVVRMEVPCCCGIEHAAVTALKNSGKFIPWNVVTISTDGRIIGTATK